MNREVFAAVADALERGEPAALVTIVSTTGSTPQRVGAKMLVFGDGRIGRHDRRRLLRERRVREGARGDRSRARRSWCTTSSRTTSRRRPASSAADRWTSTSSRSSPRPSCTSSAPAMSASTSRGIAQEVGFRVHVADDREKFANAERFPTATEIVVDDIPSWIARARIPAHAYVVIVTRGHTNDLEALRALAPRDLRYLGLIGSRAKVARIYDALTADQMPAEAAEARARPDRPRHRRGHAAGDRGQHPRGADRRQARQGPLARRCGGHRAEVSKSEVSSLKSDGADAQTSDLHVDCSCPC